MTAFDRPQCSTDDCEATVRSKIGVFGDDNPVCISCLTDLNNGAIQK